MSGQSTDWTAFETPVSDTMYDVAAAGSVAVAVGSGGTVLARHGGEWRLAARNGPNANGDTLYGVSATDDGRRAWVAGSSGSLGFYDTEKRILVNYSAPDGMTGTWEDVTVSGPAGKEVVYLADDSGMVVAGALSEQTADWKQRDDDDGDGIDGGSVEALVDEQRGLYAGNANGNVYRAGKTEWKRVGIDVPSSTIRDVLVTPDDLVAVDSSGRAFRDADDGWTWQKVAEGPLYGLTRLPASTLAVGASGRVFRREDDGEWTAVDAPVQKPLHAAATLESTAIIVGGSGRVLERTLETPDEASNAGQNESQNTEGTFSMQADSAGQRQKAAAGQQPEQGCKSESTENESRDATTESDGAPRSRSDPASSEETAPEQRTSKRNDEEPTQQRDEPATETSSRQPASGSESGTAAGENAESAGENGTTADGNGEDGDDDWL